MSINIQAIRGMNDVLPEETPYWQFVETQFKQVLQSYGYQEIRLPIVERTELFKRSIGEATDIVEKEMYTFLDRNQESLTLRPEMTAACVRAGIEHGLFHNQIQRLWFTGTCFRYEKPQKGRNRQFSQFEVDIFGLTGPDIDAELILISAQLLSTLGLSNHVTLQLNSLGSVASRAQYRKILVEYFTRHYDQLDEDSQRRLQVNPLRILDSKNPALQDLIRHAPKMTDSLDEASQQHFDRLCDYLNALKIPYEINPCLVRGLDYYSKTVFEWVTNDLGAQGTVCAGGRYDSLVEQLGGKPTPALGFAIGLDRLILLLQKVCPTLEKPALHIYWITDSDDTFAKALPLLRQMHETFPQLNMLMHCGGGSLKNQFKKADKSGAHYALILGEQEALSASITLKSLLTSAPQHIFKQNELISEINQLIAHGIFPKIR